MAQIKETLDGVLFMSNGVNMHVKNETNHFDEKYTIRIDKNKECTLKNSFGRKYEE